MLKKLAAIFILILNSGLRPGYWLLHIKAMARGFAECGADVMISSRNADELKAAAAEIGDGLNGQNAWHFLFSVFSFPTGRQDGRCELTDGFRVDAAY